MYRRPVRSTTCTVLLDIRHSAHKQYNCTSKDNQNQTLLFMTEHGRERREEVQDVTKEVDEYYDPLLDNLDMATCTYGRRRG